MKTFDPKGMNQQQLHRLLLGSIAPRPIALASTVDHDGNPNLSPFSCFNFFGVNPTTLIFSPSRRGRDNTNKHTYENLKEVPEVVINVVTFDMVQQTSLASTEYPKGVNEFVKAGFTAIASDLVKPFRVKESPVQFECKVRQIIETGDGPGAANLIICEMVKLHINTLVFDDKGEIDVDKLDAVGRLGGDFYVRTSGNAKFPVPKPLQRTGIGIDSLPEKIKYSRYLSGNDLGQLGNIENFPSTEELEALTHRYSYLKDKDEKHLFLASMELISEGSATKALTLLMAFLK